MGLGVGADAGQCRSRRVTWKAKAGRSKRRSATPKRWYCSRQAGVGSGSSMRRSTGTWPTAVSIMRRIAASTVSMTKPRTAPRSVRSAACMVMPRGGIDAGPGHRVVARRAVARQRREGVAQVAAGDDRVAQRTVRRHRRAAAQVQPQPGAPRGRHRALGQAHDGVAAEALVVGHQRGPVEAGRGQHAVAVDIRVLQQHAQQPRIDRRHERAGLRQRRMGDDRGGTCSGTVRKTQCLPSIGACGPVCHFMTISWQLHRCLPRTAPPTLAVTMSLATSPASPVPYVDRKRHAWVLSLLVPALVGLGPVLYAAWPHDADVVASGDLRLLRRAPNRPRAGRRHQQPARGRRAATGGRSVLPPRHLRAGAAAVGARSSTAPGSACARR